MVPHYILMCNSYSKGCRIALHYVGLTSDATALIDVVDKIRKECGEDSPISLHCVITKEKTWESVIQTDSFFKTVEVVPSLAEFVDMIKQDRALKGVDVAKYILSVAPCSYFALQKLTYQCYLDYAKSSDRDDHLFDDTVSLYPCNPIVESVYREFGTMAKSGELHKKRDPLAMQSRILFAKDGTRKLSSIKRTLERCKSYV